MPQIFEVVIIAFLLLISVELLLIYREVIRTQTRGRDAKEEAESTGKSGQTINVTVAGPSGLTPPSPAVVLSPESAVKASTGTTATALEAPVVKPSPERMDDRYGGSPPTPRPAPSPRPATGNPFAKVCPSCGMENSNYRTECFNCGAAL